MKVTVYSSISDKDGVRMAHKNPEGTFEARRARFLALVEMHQNISTGRQFAIRQSSEATEPQRLSVNRGHRHLRNV